MQPWSRACQLHPGRAPANSGQRQHCDANGAQSGAHMLTGNSRLSLLLRVVAGRQVGLDTGHKALCPVSRTHRAYRGLAPSVTGRLGAARCRLARSSIDCTKVARSCMRYTWHVQDMHLPRIIVGFVRETYVSVVAHRWFRSGAQSLETGAKVLLCSSWAQHPLISLFIGPRTPPPRCARQGFSVAKFPCTESTTCV